MVRTFPYIILAILIYGILFYLQNYQPAVLTSVLIKVDVFGVTKVAELEQERLLKIKNLAIPYEQKQVLINKTVFIDADTEMVKLALGGPNKAVIDHGITYYEYYLADDKRPTILVFSPEDKLTRAYKGSAIDPVDAPR